MFGKRESDTVRVENWCQNLSHQLFGEKDAPCLYSLSINVTCATCFS